MMMKSSVVYCVVAQRVALWVCVCVMSFNSRDCVLICFVGNWQVGFYGESGLGSSGHSSSSNGKDWVFRPLSALDCCRDPEKVRTYPCHTVPCVWCH